MNVGGDENDDDEEDEGEEEEEGEEEGEKEESRLSSRSAAVRAGPAFQTRPKARGTEAMILRTSPRTRRGPEGV